MARKSRRFKVGDWVEVRSQKEILETLDSSGGLDGMPFMPEMFAFCGRRFQVYRRAHKTCDTVFPVRGRRVDLAVHLETRCAGDAHEGCQAGCLIFWKEAWLRRVSGPAPADGTREAPSSAGRPAPDSAGCSYSDVWANTRTSHSASGEIRYVCQATQLPYATRRLDWWDIRQYWEDLRSGNVNLRRLLNGLVYSAYYHLSQAGIGVGPAMRWFYDRFHPIWRGTLFPRKTGTIPDRSATPTGVLNLQPGELVRVKQHEEILRTLNASSRNRGLLWDAEMVPYCGKTYRVLKRVTKIIDERTGQMQQMKTPCIVLGSVVCQARYSHCRLFCPRSIYPYWREIWLERLDSPQAETEHAVASSGSRSQTAKATAESPVGD